MKTNVKMIILVFLLGSGMSFMSVDANAHRRHHYEPFYYDLLPYGNWINTPDYGLVWIPAVAGGFQPYMTDGHWIYTFSGWSWVSYYDWGWAPFHYGRWYYDSWYGWAWVPGYEWGPGWVAWSHCDGYYGWAPLAPGFRFDRPIQSIHEFPGNHWVYVQANHFGEPFRAEHYKKGHDAERIHARASVISRVDTEKEGKTRFFRGPEVQEVRKSTGREIRSHEFVRKSETPDRKPTGSDSKISSFRDKKNPSGYERKGRPENRTKPDKVRSSVSANYPAKGTRSNPVRNQPGK